MSSVVNFTGSPFSLETVVQTALATLRVRFTQDPLAASSVGANDATNPANYVLAGPGINAILNGAAVFGDPQAVDLFLAGPLAPGVWTLTVATNVVEVGLTLISDPRSASFTALIQADQEAVNKGTENDDDADILRKHLNPALKGAGWNALISAMATGDRTNRANAALAFDQLFKSTASGIYLARHAADDGLQKPKNIGIPDDLFRTYAIKSTTSKLVEPALLEIMEVFYGADSVRAHVDSGLQEPFVMAEGEDITVLIDESLSVTTVFKDEDFAITGIAKAAEVAAALTRAFAFAGSNAYALALKDPESGGTRVRIYSGSLGLKSAVRVTGGAAQNQLQFDQLLPAFSGFIQPFWQITFDAASGRTRFLKQNGVVNPDLSQVIIGDYVNIYGNEFSPGNRGSFPIVNVYYSYVSGQIYEYFEILHQGVVENVSQLENASLIFFRPIKKTIHTIQSRSVVIASLPEGVDAVLPATSQAVGRKMRSAAYAQLNASIAITALERINGVVTVDTAVNHGLSVGDQVFIDGIFGVAVIPGTTAGSFPAALSSCTSDLSKGSIWSHTAGTAHPNGAAGGVAVRLLDGRVFHAFGYALNSGSLNDSITFYDAFDVTAQATLGTGTIQATFIERDQGGGSNTVPHALNYPGASLGINLGWYYGQVLVTGGESLFGSRGTTNVVGLYSPTAAGSSTPGPYANQTITLLTARAAHGQVTLNNPSQAFHGGFFVCGGINNSYNAIATCERYSLVEGSGAATFAARASMNDPRAQHETVVLQDGRILVIGGRQPLGSSGSFYWGTRSNIGPILGSCEIYDPVANTWVKTGSLTFSRFQHRAVLLADGRVLVVGGIGFNPTQPTTLPIDVVDAEIYNPATGAWQPAGRLTWARSSVVANYLASRNQVVVSGGSDPAGGVKTELFDVATMKWSIGSATLPAARPGAVSAVAGADLIVMIGGYDSGTGNSASTMSLYVPNADKFLGGGLNGIFAISQIVDANTFQYVTNEKQYTLSGSSVGTVTPVAARDSEVPGPYIFEPDGGLAVTGEESVLAQDIKSHQHYASVAVADATQFPDEPGWLVFAFGYANQVGPVKYFGRLNSTALSLDYNFRFPVTIPSGSVVTLLAHKGPFAPDNAPDLGACYLTDSPAGRVAAQAALAAATAAGIPVNVTIVYPGDRGLGGEGKPTHGSNKLSDIVSVFSGDDIDAEVAAAKEE